MSALLDLIAAGAKPMVGMVQLDPLPGSARHAGGSLADRIEEALAEAEALVTAGVDALMVQNLGDLPVAHSVTPAQLAWTVRICDEVRRASGLPVGLNFLENDAAAMVTAASAAGLDFVRIKVFVGAMLTPFGVEHAAAHAALKARNALGAHGVALFADVHDRTGVPLGTADLAEDIGYALKLSGADGLVLTGKSHDRTLAFLRIAREVAPTAPILVGGGASADNIDGILDLADGAIVSSSLKPSGAAFGRIDPDKAQSFMAAVARARAGTPEVAGTQADPKDQ